MKHLLSSTAFLVLNKGLAREIGVKAAVLLADLISKEEYFIANGMTDGWFFNTEANIEEDTTLNSYHQRKCVKTLKEKGLIQVEALTYIRGRSIADAFIIIDEAQNLTRHEIKTILTNVKKDPITGRYTYDEKIKTIQPLMPSPMTVKVYRLPNE